MRNLVVKNPNARFLLRRNDNYLTGFGISTRRARFVIHCAKDGNKAKGWYVGPWNSAISFPIGYANEGINEKHYHSEMYEVYLIAKGSSTAIVNDNKIELQAGDILVVEPGEIHTFVQSSEDYLHFVIQTPFVKNDKVVVG